MEKISYIRLYACLLILLQLYVFIKVLFSLQFFEFSPNLNDIDIWTEIIIVITVVATTIIMIANFFFAI